MDQNKPDQPPAEGSDKEQLKDPKTFEAYEEAMGDLSDADGAASLGGPAA